MNNAMTKYSNKFHGYVHNARRYIGKAAGATGAMLASGAAFAQTSPGGAIAAELASAKSEVMGVIALLAIVVGVLLLWAYVKRAR